MAVKSFHDHISTKECAGREDRTRDSLLAVIKTTFGSETPFNLTTPGFWDPGLMEILTV